MTVEMTAEEATLLREVLESYLSDLRMEIADTDQQDFRNQLKDKKHILETIAGRLQETSA